MVTIATECPPPDLCGHKGAHTGTSNVAGSQSGYVHLYMPKLYVLFMMQSFNWFTESDMLLAVQTHWLLFVYNLL